MVKSIRRAKVDEELTSIRSTGEASNKLMQEALPLLRDIHAAHCQGQVPPAVDAIRDGARLNLDRTEATLIADQNARVRCIESTLEGLKEQIGNVHTVAVEGRPVVGVHVRADGEPIDMENFRAVSAASRIAKAGWTTCREAALAKKSEHEVTVKETQVKKLEALALRKQHALEKIEIAKSLTPRRGAATAASGAASSGAVPTTEEVRVEMMSVPELKAALRAQAKPLGGKKSDLVARLIACSA